MSTFDVTVTLERKVDKIVIEGGRAYIIARIREPNRDATIQVYEVDVTDILSQQRLDEISALETDAQTWLDNQPFTI
jgi:hypothetical protein